MRSLSALPASALCAALLIFAALPASAAATAGQAEIDAATAGAVQYLRAQQDPGSGELLGYENGPFSSDWAAVALAGAGVSSADVRAGAGAPSLQDFLLGQYSSGFWTGAPSTAATNYERVTLVARAAGLDPARLSAESNLPAQIAGRWNPVAGSFGEPSTRSTSLGILALSAEPVPAWAFAPAVAFLRRSQHDDGGWTEAAATTPAARAEPSEPEDTGAAIAALCAAGAPAYDPAVADAFAYLQGQLVEASGAIRSAGSDNADATAWAVDGVEACGVDPQSTPWRTATGKTPIDFLLSLQEPAGPEAGGFGFEAGEAPNLYSTQDALRAITGGAFLAPPPGPIDPPAPSVRPAPAVAAGTPVPHLLAIELAPSNVRLCKVTARAGALLPEVLSAAQAEAVPAGCVTSFALVGGELGSLDGVAPQNEDDAWLLRLDRGAQAVAGEQPVEFGEVISLRLGTPPAGGSAPETGTVAPPRGAAGVSGAPGRRGHRGPRGRRGPKGRPGHVGKTRCKGRHAHRGRSSPRSGARRPHRACARAKPDR